MAKKRSDKTLKLLLSTTSIHGKKTPTRFQKKSAKDYVKKTKAKWI